MKRITQWRPDTCSCIIDYEWDDLEPQETRQHIISAVHQKCEAHADLDPGEVFSVVTDENQMKNRTFAAICEVMGKRSEEMLEETTFSFDAERKLSFDVKGMTREQRTEIESKIEEHPDIPTEKVKSIRAV